MDAEGGRSGDGRLLIGQASEDTPADEGKSDDGERGWG